MKRGELPKPKFPSEFRSRSGLEGDTKSSWNGDTKVPFKRSLEFAKAKNAARFAQHLEIDYFVQPIGFQYKNRVGCGIVEQLHEPNKLQQTWIKTMFMGSHIATLVGIVGVDISMHERNICTS